MNVLLALVLTVQAKYEPAAPWLFREPTVSRTTVVFSFSNELWSVNRSGGKATKIDIGPGVKRNPHFSPDGEKIAFTWNRNGDDDVYVVPASGGTPRRLTYYPGEDGAIGWTPDGKRVLFRSTRDAATPVPHLFTISCEGGPAVELPLPIAAEGSYSEDGLHLAYVPMAQWQDYWRSYRGGQTKPIWIVDLKSLLVQKLPRHNSNDYNPMCAGQYVYFLSDRDGPTGIYAYDMSNRKVNQVVKSAGFDIRSASLGAGVIAYEQLGSLNLFDLRTQRTSRIDIRLDASFESTLPHTVKVGSQIDSGDLSPNGDKAVFAARGEIVTLSKNGTASDLSQTPDATERDPAWSPDGKQIAYFSDEGGEYRLCIQRVDGSATQSTIHLCDHPGIPSKPVWSPDCSRIAFSDSRERLWCADLASRRLTLVDSNPKPSQPSFDFAPSWSPDSRWIAYARQLDTWMNAVFLFSTATAEKHRITGGLADVRSPAFDKNGKYLYVTASTDLGLSLWVADMSSIARSVSRRVYAIGLEEDPVGFSDSTIARASSSVPIAFSGIEGRVFALTLPPHNYQRLESGAPGQLFALWAADTFFPFGPVQMSVGRFDVRTGLEKDIASGATGFRLAASGNECLIQKYSSWWISPADRPLGATEPALDTANMSVSVDPTREWRAMYEEAWNYVRDAFYDPRYHGLNLEAERSCYRPFLGQLRSRSDLNYLFENMLGDLGSSHVSANGGDIPEPKGIQAGMLGADFVADHGRYRFSRIYDGESWNPYPVPPLNQPGARVKAGEYLLAVDGQPVDLSSEVYKWFDGKEGIRTRITVGPRPDDVGSREVVVVPIHDENNLRRNAWIEANRRRVEQLSGGRLAYVYLPNTHINGQASFVREFFSQSGKEGVVIDERFNGGGFTADFIVDYLKRPELGFLQDAQGNRVTTPAAAIFGPKAMIVNELAGSGGDALAWMFRKLKLGPLVGMRTWGGLRSVIGAAPLLDGGSVAVPQLAFWNADGSWAIENHGVDPDFHVENDPRSIAEGRDPQLEKAVSVVMARLKLTLPEVRHAFAGTFLRLDTGPS